MKKLILFLLLCSTAWASKTTLTGTITDSQGNLLNGILVMQLPVPAQDTTTNTAVAPSPVYFRLVNGAITGGAQLYDVANLQPQGLYYQGAAYDTTGAKVFGGNFYVSGATFNMGAGSPTSVTTSNVTYAGLCLTTPGPCTSITTQSLNGVRTVTANDPGVDMCAKIGAVVAAAPAGGLDIDARSFTGTQACASNPLATINGPFKLWLGSVTIQTTVQWLYSFSPGGTGVSPFEIAGAGTDNTILQYTGTGAVSAVLAISPASPTVNFIQNFNIHDMQISGNSHTTDVLSIISGMRSVVARLDLRNTTRACVSTQFALVVSFYDIRCSSNLYTFTVQPTNCFIFGQLDATHRSGGNVIWAADCEGGSATGSGIKFDGSQSNLVIGGTSEGWNRNLEVTANSFYTEMRGLDLEFATTEDLLDNGTHTIISGSSFTSKGIHLGSTSLAAEIYDVSTTNITVDAGAKSASFTNATFNIGGSNTVTDNGTDTKWDNLFNAVSQQRAAIGANSNGFTARDVIPATGPIGPGVSRQSFLRGSWLFNNVNSLIDSTVVSANPWRMVFIGLWGNDVEGGGLVMPPLYTEVTSVSPTVVIGSTTLTISLNGSNQFQAVVGSAQKIAFTGTIIHVTDSTGVAGNYSMSLKGLLGAGNTQRLTADAAAITATTPGTTVFTWGALPPQSNWSFHCEILYNQQTAAVAGDGFAVQGATNAPTRLDSWGTMYTTNPASAAPAASQGSANNITTTTATSVVTATPSAITTIFQAVLNGTIQVGASASTLNVLMFTGNAADSITPKAGSFCALTP